MRGFGLQVLGAVFGLVICMGGLPYPALAGEGWQHRLPHRHACVTLDPADSCSQIIEHAPPQARRGLRQIARAVSSLEARQPIGGQSGINTRFVNGISHGVSCGVLTNVPVMFYNNCVHAVNPKIKAALGPGALPVRPARMPAQSIAAGRLMSELPPSRILRSRHLDHAVAFMCRHCERNCCIELTIMP